jgi:hypothetical protein
MAAMVGRALAGCGWLAAHLERLLSASRPPRWLRGQRVVAAVALFLALVALVPIGVVVVIPQPQEATVQQILDGEAGQPGAWVRLRGRDLVPLHEAPDVVAGRYALLVDARRETLAIVVRSDQPIAAAAGAMVTGHAALAAVTVAEELPIEATVAGSPPRIVPDRVVVLDAVPHPEQGLLWPITLVAGLPALVLGIGARAGYPVFRPAREVDVLARPIGAGERVPAAVAGRIGAVTYRLVDPAEAILLAEHEQRGSTLTVQLLPGIGRPLPPPITVGGTGARGRIGYVHTIDETVPALQVRADDIDAVILFSRTAERDRAAALVPVER